MSLKNYLVAVSGRRFLLVPNFCEAVAKQQPDGIVIRLLGHVLGS